LYDTSIGLDEKILLLIADMTFYPFKCSINGKITGENCNYNTIRGQLKTHMDWDVYQQCYNAVMQGIFFKTPERKLQRLPYIRGLKHAARDIIKITQIIAETTVFVV